MVTRSGLLGLVFAALAGAGSVACDDAFARPARSPLPAARIACAEADAPGDDDGMEQWLPDDAPAPRSCVEYVKLTEWTPPPSVRELEASIPPRGDVPPTYTSFPPLTRHSPIGASGRRRR